MAKVAGFCAIIFCLAPAAQRKITELIKISSYISHFKQDNAFFPSISGNERRNIFDVRLAGKAASFDWDLETMEQTGNIANKNIRAWAFGSVSGYTFDQALSVFLGDILEPIMKLISTGKYRRIFIICLK